MIAGFSIYFGKNKEKQKGTSLVRKRNVIQPFNRSGAAIDQLEKKTVYT